MMIIYQNKMLRKKYGTLKPIDSNDTLDPIQVLDDLSKKYDEVNERSIKINNTLQSLSDSNIFREKTKKNIDSFVKENKEKNEEFKQNLENSKQKIKKIKKKELNILVPLNESSKIGTDFMNVVDNKIKNVEYKNNDILCDLMTKNLDNDKTLNKNLTSFEFGEISKNILRYEKIIRNYRSYYGRNPLRWTPGERKTVSSMYFALSKEYGKLHYEQGRDVNKLIAENLLNNPLNRLRKYNGPSAPRGPNNLISSNNFKKWVDGD